MCEAHLQVFSASFVSRMHKLLTSQMLDHQITFKWIIKTTKLKNSASRRSRTSIFCHMHSINWRFPRWDNVCFKTLNLSPRLLHILLLNQFILTRTFLKEVCNLQNSILGFSCSFVLLILFSFFFFANNSAKAFKATDNINLMCGRAQWLSGGLSDISAITAAVLIQRLRPVRI